MSNIRNTRNTRSNLNSIANNQQSNNANSMSNLESISQLRGASIQHVAALAVPLILEHVIDSPAIDLSMIRNLPDSEILLQCAKILVQHDGTSSLAEAFELVDIACEPDDRTTATKKGLLCVIAIQNTLGNTRFDRPAADSNNA